MTKKLDALGYVSIVMIIAIAVLSTIYFIEDSKFEAMVLAGIGFILMLITDIRFEMGIH